MVIFSDIETVFAANDGIQDPVSAIKPFLTRHLVTAGGIIPIIVMLLFSY